MIKANELRIGNCVKLNNSYTTLVPRDFQRYCKSFGIFEEFEPIELSEEWLLKAGFKYKKYHPTTIGSADVFGSGLYVSQMINNGFSLVFQTDKKSFYFEFSDRYIKYVHELQNIYFALTGVELVFTTEP